LHRAVIKKNSGVSVVAVVW